MSSNVKIQWNKNKYLVEKKNLYNNTPVGKYIILLLLLLFLFKSWIIVNLEEKKKPELL